MLFSVASYSSSIMWQNVQMMKVLKCHIRNFFATIRWCKDTKFSRHIIKTPRLSSHIYYIGLGASQPRGPNYTIRTVYSIIIRSNFILTSQKYLKQRLQLFLFSPK